ncbi:flippase-like domain-containing protein [candidate division KSB1 bacterium]|nr:flippase-like domain-containing protein [candidate division KSB1 bacterium]
MRGSKLLVSLVLSLFFLYLTVFKPHLGELFSATAGPGAALFSDPRFAISDLGRVLTQARWSWILLTGVVFMASLFIRAWRWRLMLRPLVRISFWRTFGAMSIGYMANNVLPLRMGEVYKAQVVHQLSGLSRTAAFGSIVLERLVDLVFMIPFIGLAVVLYPLPGVVQKAAYASAIGAFAVTGFFVWLALDRAPAMRFAGKCLKLVPSRLSAGILQALDRFTDGFVVLGRKEALLGLAASSIVMWVMYVTMVYWVMRSVGLVEPGLPLIWDNPLGATIVILVITTFGLVMPGAPGAVGTYHGVAVLALSLFGVPGDRAVGFAVLLHALNYIPLTALGLFFFWKHGLSFSGSKTLAAEFEVETHAPHAPVDVSKRKLPMS